MPKKFNPLSCFSANPEDKKDARTPTPRRNKADIVHTTLSNPPTETSQAAEKRLITPQTLQSVKLKKRIPGENPAPSSDGGSDQTFVMDQTVLTTALGSLKNSAESPRPSAASESKPSELEIKLADRRKKLEEEASNMNKDPVQLPISSGEPLTGATEKEEANTQGEAVISANCSSKSENERLYERILPLIMELENLLSKLKHLLDIHPYDFAALANEEALNPDFMSDLDFEINEKYSSTEGLKEQDFQDLENLVSRLKKLLPLIRPLSTIDEKGESRVGSMIEYRNSMQPKSEMTEPSRKSAQRKSVLDDLDKLIEQLNNFNPNLTYQSKQPPTDFFKPAPLNLPVVDSNKGATLRNGLS